MRVRWNAFRPSVVIYLLIVLLFPFLIGDDYYRSVGVVIGLHAIVAIGLGLLMGLAGQISLGQAGFWGIGAYASAILSVKFGVPPVVGVLAGTVLPGIVAYFVARAIAELQGYYLAMATLAFGYIVQIAIIEGGSVTGGANGMISIPSLTVFGFGNSELSMYYLVWIVVTLVLLFSLNLMNSRVGRAYRAIHKSEIAATSMGIHVAQFKLSAFVVSGMFAGLSGALYAHYMGILDPQPFGLNESIKFLTMVVIGGMTSIWGALLGAVIIDFLNELLILLGEHLPWLKGDIDTIVFGAILVLIMMFMPEGLLPRLQAVRKNRRSKAQAVPALEKVEMESVA